MRKTGFKVETLTNSPQDRRAPPAEEMPWSNAQPSQGSVSLVSPGGGGIATSGWVAPRVLKYEAQNSGRHGRPLTPLWRSFLAVEDMPMDKFDT
jgi:hypothetical protein